MALKDFWMNVRTGAGLIAPTVGVVSGRLNAGRIAETLRSAYLWLTPKYVEGFVEGDFDFCRTKINSDWPQPWGSFRRLPRKSRQMGRRHPVKAGRRCKSCKKLWGYSVLTAMPILRRLLRGNASSTQLAEKCPSGYASCDLRVVEM